MIWAPRLTAGVGVAGAILAVTLSACSSAGDLNIVNDGPGEVTVLTGDEEVVVDADGGAALLNYGCTPGDVTVVFESGPELTLPGPVCPETWIVVGDGTAELRPAPSNDDPTGH